MPAARLSRCVWGQAPRRARDSASQASGSCQPSVFAAREKPPQRCRKQSERRGVRRPAPSAYARAQRVDEPQRSPAPKASGAPSPWRFADPIPRPQRSRERVRASFESVNYPETFASKSQEASVREGAGRLDPWRAERSSSSQQLVEAFGPRRHRRRKSTEQCPMRGLPGRPFRPMPSLPAGRLISHLARQNPTAPKRRKMS
jgi:hypothetical protein